MDNSASFSNFYGDIWLGSKTSKSLISCLPLSQVKICQWKRKNHVVYSHNNRGSKLLSWTVTCRNLKIMATWAVLKTFEITNTYFFPKFLKKILRHSRSDYCYKGFSPDSSLGFKWAGLYQDMFNTCPKDNREGRDGNNWIGNRSQLLRAE